MANDDYQQLFNAQVADALAEYTRLGNFSRLLGIEVVESGPGRLVCTLEVRDDHQSGIGAVHGGAISSLVDHTLSLTVYPLVEVGKWVATQEFKINYLNAVRGGTITATGQLLSLRRQLAVVRVDVENEGRLVAVAQGTLYVRDR